MHLIVDSKVSLIFTLSDHHQIAGGPENHDEKLLIDYRGRINRHHEITGGPENHGETF